MNFWIAAFMGLVFGGGLVGIVAVKRIMTLEDRNEKLKQIIQEQDDEIATLQELADENF